MIRSILLIVAGFAASLTPALGQAKATQAKIENAEQLLQAAQSGAANLQGIAECHGIPKSVCNPRLLLPIAF
jgi:hypothetical protein